MTLCTLMICLFGEATPCHSRANMLHPVFALVTLLFMTARRVCGNDYAIINSPTDGVILPQNRPFILNASISPEPGSAILVCAQGTDSVLGDITSDVNVLFTPNVDQTGLCTLNVTTLTTSLTGSITLTLFLPLDRFNYASYRTPVHFSTAYPVTS